MSTRSLPIEHVVVTEGFRDGEPYVAGKNVSVREVALAHTHAGAGIEEIATAYNLTPAQVHAALSYYYDHRMEIDPQIDPNARIALPDNPLREMTASEVANRYGISPQAVRLAAGSGQIAARKSGATWLIRRRDAEAKWGKPR